MKIVSTSLSRTSLVAGFAVIAGKGLMLHLVQQIGPPAAMRVMAAETAGGRGGDTAVPLDEIGAVDCMTGNADLFGRAIEKMRAA